MAKSAIEGASMNVRINLGSIKDKAFAGNLKTRLTKIIKQSDELFAKTKGIIEGKLG
jgi:formiminotetrahydrofolate cyclodeaminase